MTNRQLTKQVKQIKNDVELKYKDTLFAVGQSEMDSFKPFNIGLVGNGTDDKARIGDEIKHTSLKFRLWMNFNPNSVIGATAFVRMIICYDMAPTGIPVTDGNPPLDVIYGSPDRSLLDLASTDRPITAQYSLQNVAERYKVLYDKVFTLNSRSYNGFNELAAPIGMYLKKTIKLSRKAIYNGPDPSYPDILTNALYVGWQFYAPNSNEADADQIALEGSFRLYYKDM